MPPDLPRSLRLHQSLRKSVSIYPRSVLDIPKSFVLCTFLRHLFSKLNCNVKDHYSVPARKFCLRAKVAPTTQGRI